VLVLITSTYPGTQVTWLPLGVANAVRIVMWLWAMTLAYRLVWRAMTDRGSPPLVFWSRIALFILVIQQAILNAERFGQPLTYETLLSIPAYACLELASSRVKVKT